MVKVPVIARLFMDKLRQDQDLMPKTIQQMIKNQWKLIATRNQCQAARNKALKWIEKEYDVQFSHLRGYAEEIINSNPGSTVAIETIPRPNGDEVFYHFYVCFEKLRTTWKQTCRPIIGVDGCFLKATFKGQLLATIGRDPNNQIFPVAWVVVQVENTDNWLWFINKLKNDLCLGDGNGFIIVSDRQKGLLNVIQQELPNIEHRMCVRHIYGNVKAKHGKKHALKPLVWKLTWSYNISEYEENLKRLREYDVDVFEDVMKTNPKSWCRVFYKIGFCCEDVDNNSTESFNKSILQASTKPMVPMLETIRRQAMVRISTRFTIANQHTGKFTPIVTKYLDLERENVAKCMTYPGTDGWFEIELFGNSDRVNMRRRTCTCCKWEITGIPCDHALGAIMDMGLNVEEYISDYFLTSRWRDTYQSSIIPLRGAHFLTRDTTSLISAPPAPNLPGRKKKIPRKKAVNESPSKKKSKLSKRGRIMHCKKCGLANHNIRGCNKNVQHVS